MKKTYRAGIIGLGFIGGADQVSGDALGQQVTGLDGTHLEALARHPSVALVAGSSRDLGRRQRFVERTQAKTYADWRQMLEQESLDIVSVATYAPLHAEMTIACVEQGVRVVYCEKPIATNVSDAQRMVEACEQAGTLLVINHNRRFDSNYRRLRDVIASGGFGEVTSVSLQWGTGRLGNVGTHNIDLMQMLTGRRIQAVSGTLDLAGKPDCRGTDFHDPGGWGLMRLDNGVMVTVDAADYATMPYRITVSGTLGRAVAGSAKAAVRIEMLDGRTEIWAAPPAVPSSMDVAVGEIVEWLDGSSDDNSDRATPFSYPAELAVHTLEAIVAFHASHARGAAWCALPLSGADREREVRTG